MYFSGLFRRMKLAVVLLCPLTVITACGEEAGTIVEGPRLVDIPRQVESPWKGAGLEFSMLEERVNTPSCLQTPTRFLACIAAVQTLLDTSPRALQLVHASWLSNSDAAYRGKRRFGEVVVAEAAQKAHANVLDEIRARRKRILDWQAIYLNSALLQADFTGLLEWARKELIGPGEEEHYTATAINGYLGVEDAHAQIVPAPVPADAASRRAAGGLPENNTHSYTGIGASLHALAGSSIIMGIVPESPAAAAGVMASDVVLAVDGQPVAGKSVPEVVAMLRGAEGTEVSLRLQRQKRVYETRLRRSTVNIRNVSSSVLDDRDRSRGYLRIVSFNSETTCADTRRELHALVNSGVEGILLDLRDNSGGLVDQAVCVADLFFEPRVLVLEIRSTQHRGQSTPLYSRQPAMTLVPLVTLVNAATGSASEALAGALQDHGRSLIIGERTFGKGTIQTLRPWNDSGSIMLFSTTARMYTPAGRTAQLAGIEPDLRVTAQDSDPQPGRTILREEDLFPTALPSSGTRPGRRPYRHLAGIEACLESKGLAGSRRSQRLPSSAVRDYPRAVGYDVLHCLDTVGNGQPEDLRLAGPR